jgi:hypothetical protein
MMRRARGCRAKPLAAVEQTLASLEVMLYACNDNLVGVLTGTRSKVDTMARGPMNRPNRPNAWPRLSDAGQRFLLAGPNRTQTALRCRSAFEADSRTRIDDQETPFAVIRLVVVAFVFEVGGAWTISLILLRYATRLGYFAIVALGGVSRGA